eukprot:m.3887 g.3887  ORF g.3887 m.3887 type:complete len:287 (-) comp2830_c0_seq1:172-1032(-)
MPMVLVSWDGTYKRWIMQWIGRKKTEELISIVSQQHQLQSELELEIAKNGWATTLNIHHMGDASQHLLRTLLSNRHIDDSLYAEISRRADAILCDTKERDVAAISRNQTRLDTISALISIVDDNSNIVDYRSLTTEIAASVVWQQCVDVVASITSKTVNRNDDTSNSLNNIYDSDGLNQRNRTLVSQALNSALTPFHDMPNGLDIVMLALSLGLQNTTPTQQDSLVRKAIEDWLFSNGDKLWTSNSDLLEQLAAASNAFKEALEVYKDAKDLKDYMFQDSEDTSTQ